MTAEHFEYFGCSGRISCLDKQICFTASSYLLPEAAQSVSGPSEFIEYLIAHLHSPAGFHASLKQLTSQKICCFIQSNSLTQSSEITSTAETLRNDCDTY